MSSKQRRAELRAEREIEDKLRDDEDRRRANLSMYERIEESNAGWRMKEILHMLAQKLGMEL